MITITQILYFTSYLLPIPFMSLFYIKTNKLDFLKKYGIFTLFIPIFIQLIFGGTGFTITLIFAYMIFILFGAFVLSEKGWGYPQALSIAFCLTFFGSLLWETPIIVYTIIIRGGVDGAFPLHLIYIFPMVFIYEKVKTNCAKRDIFAIGKWVMGFSVLMLYGLVSSNINVWQIQQNSLTNQAIEQTVWMVDRIVVILFLFLIYSKSSVRKVKKT